MSPVPIVSFFSTHENTGSDEHCLPVDCRYTALPVLLSPYLVSRQIVLIQRLDPIGSNKNRPNETLDPIGPETKDILRSVQDFSETGSSPGSLGSQTRSSPAWQRSPVPETPRNPPPPRPAQSQAARTTAERGNSQAWLQLTARSRFISTDPVSRKSNIFVVLLLPVMKGKISACFNNQVSSFVFLLFHFSSKMHARNSKPH